MSNPTDPIGPAARGPDADDTELPARRPAVSPDWFRAAFTSVPDAVLAAGMDGRVTWLNPAAERLTGWTAGEARGQPAALVFRPLDERTGIPVESPVETVLRDGDTVAFGAHALLASRHGGALASEGTAAPIRDADMRMHGVVVVFRDVADRRRADDVLREREERWRATFAQAAVGIAIGTLEGRFLEVNRKFTEILGFASTELRARTWGDITYPDDLAESRLKLAQLMSGEVSDFSLEKRYVRRDGAIVWSQTTVTVLRDGEGRPRRLIAVIEDVTPRRRAEAAVRDGARRLRLALAAARLGDWMWDFVTDLVTLSPRAAEIFGTGGGDPVTWARLRESIHEDDRERVRRAVDVSLATRRDYDIEYRVRRSSGDVVWVTARGAGTYAEDGRVLGMLGVLADVTDRKRSEEALRDETRVLELVNRTGMSLAAKLDLKTLVQGVTDSATVLSGAQFGAFFYNSINEQGESYMLYALSGAPPEAFGNIGQPRATPLFGPTFRGEATIRSDDITKDPRYGQMAPHRGMPPGHLPVCSYLAVPVVSRAGEVIGGLFFGHPQPGVFTERAERIIAGIAAQASIAIDNARLYEDVRRAAAERERLLAAERAARSEAERASVMKDEFLATLSHELRTPLNAILGWAEILLSGRAGPDGTRRGAETIARNARAQAQLIADLLEMNRIVSGKLRLDVQPTDVGAVVDAAVEAVRPSADAKRVVLEQQVEPGVAPVAGDPNRLQQVVWNLLSNAVKFTPDGGRVVVRVSQSRERVDVAVTDTGMGIEPEFLPHVFERFRQADASTTRPHGGLGLGLAIVKQLVDMHGGTVEASSDGPGRGSSFVVGLPACAPAPAADAVSASTVDANAPVALDGLRVLVVDDEPDARDLVRVLLEECGADVTLATGAQDALAKIDVVRPDLVVSDIGMPGMDGYQLMRELRTRAPEKGGRVPAIALTAFARPEDRTRAMLAGYHAHIAKPIEPRELLATVAGLVR